MARRIGFLFLGILAGSSIPFISTVSPALLFLSVFIPILVADTVILTIAPRLPFWIAALHAVGVATLLGAHLFLLALLARYLLSLEIGIVAVSAAGMIPSTLLLFCSYGLVSRLSDFCSRYRCHPRPVMVKNSGHRKPESAEGEVG